MNDQLDEYDKKCIELTRAREEVDLESPISIHVRNDERRSTPPSLIRAANETVQERYWHSPCGHRYEVNCIKFIVQYILIVGLISFFSLGLYRADTCESSNLYQSLLMLIVGIALPSPSMK